MAQCCYDEDALIAYDFEDAAPLSAYFDNIIGSVANTASAGINSTRGARSSSQFDEFSRTYTLHVDDCGNGRRAFGIGGYWKVDSTSNNFYIMEVRDTNLGGQTVYSIYQDGVNLVIYNGTGSDELYRVSNVFVVGTFRKIEVRGSVSSYNEDTIESGNDGFLEVRINKRVYKNGDDFAAIDPTSPPESCEAGVSGIITGRVVSGWNRIVFYPHGDLDCIYIKESATYCNDRELGTPGDRKSVV